MILTFTTSLKFGEAPVIPSTDMQQLNALRMATVQILISFRDIIGRNTQKCCSKGKILLTLW